MRPKPNTIAECFIAEVMAGTRKERAEGAAEAIQARLPLVLPKRGGPKTEARMYFAACERAWLHWSRLALEHIILHGLDQASNGTPNPAHVRTADDAARAEAKCSIHLRLLGAIPEGLLDPQWPWHLEAAQHVHASTRTALKIAASIDQYQPSLDGLRLGTKWIADALVTASAAGFVADTASEATRTLDAMLRAGSET